MSALSRARRPFVALLLCLCVLGCGGPDDQGGGQGGRQGRSRQRGEAPGAPANEGDGQQAVGAPIMIPSIVQDQGRPLDEVRAEIESSVRDQCGDGELCVDLPVEERDESFTSCQFVMTEPAQGTEVERGSTVVIVAGVNPCEQPSSEGEPPADDGGASENGVPQPPASS